MNERQVAALRLARRGFLVMPARKPVPGATKASSAKDQGKVPFATDWQNSQRLTEAQIEHFWTDEANISILTGPASGVFVWDIDGAVGFDTMRDLIAQHGPLPSTYVVKTGSGGYHYYFAYPQDFRVGNRQRVRPGIDIRGEGGQVIAAGSATCFGPYSDNGDAAIAPAPQWMLDMLRPQAEPARVTEHQTPLAGPVKPTAASDYEHNIVTAELARLQALAARPWQEGAGWDTTTYEVACTLLQIANSPWSALLPDHVPLLLAEHAPRDEVWGEAEIEAKWASARRKVGNKGRPAPAGPAPQLASLSGSTFPAASSNVATSPGRVISADDHVDVSNPSLAAQWLRSEIGTTRLSGIFYRKGELVFTPRVGESGYIEARDSFAEGSASITVLGETELRARVQNRYNVIKLVKRGEEYKPTPAMFPLEAAQVVARTPNDTPNLRTLHGVVHTPTFRPDGSLITAPGYDDATGILFLPTGGQPRPVPEYPSAQDVADAKHRVDYMLQDFRFVTEHDRASYLGLLMTPLLRAMVPPPYKLGVIEAHQPGSGKTFLARAITSIHGGLMHAEMPSDEPELAKVIGAILDTQTAPVVAFDNVTGLVRSPTLAGLLTSPTFQGRRLGSSTVIEADNDRLWLLTGNNAALSGDLGRRNVRVLIDPGVPNPEQRTGFAIKGFERWVRENRGELLWALLVLVRAWVVAGSPLVAEPTEDTYGQWTSTIRGILRHAAIPGDFDSTLTQSYQVDPDAEEWSQFLHAVADVMGENPWTAKSLLALVQHAAFQVEDPAKPIPYDTLPSDLVRQGTPEPARLVKSLGRWLTNREGRWYGDLTIRKVKSSEKKGSTWRLVRYSS